MNARNNRELGAHGEELAARHLAEDGFEIIARNVHTGHTETDIIARNGTTLLFAEVKTREYKSASPRSLRRPALAVDRRKAECLRASAEEFLRRNPEVKGERFVRFEVIEVMLVQDAVTVRRIHMTE